MPRDLEAERNGLPELSREATHEERDDTSNITAEPESLPTESDPQRQKPAKTQQDAGKMSKLYDLHPYGQLLTVSDVDSCVQLENAAFTNPDHRCTREKFIYRLSVCPELCSGLWMSAEPDSEHMDVSTASTAGEVQTGASRKRILIGHIISTKTTNKTVQNEDMEIPTNWQTTSTLTDEKVGGHKEHGTTIAIHSLAVLPKFQRTGVGKTLLRDYIAKMYDQKVGERIAIITYENLVPYYERFGFKKLGPSQASYGGGGWVDMEYDLMFEK